MFYLTCSMIHVPSGVDIARNGVTDARGRTYVMITYVSKENNLGPGHRIRYIWGLKGPIFIL